MTQQNRVFTIIACSFAISILAHDSSQGFLLDKEERQVSSICPAETERNRRYVESFFLSNSLAQRRVELGIGHIDTDDIYLLKSPEDDLICQQLYQLHQQAIEAMYEGQPKYEVVFYKAGDFYFVTGQFRLPDNPNQIIFGVQGITIYDQNLNRLTGISY